MRPKGFMVNHSGSPGGRSCPDPVERGRTLTCAVSGSCSEVDMAVVRRYDALSPALAGGERGSRGQQLEGAFSNG
jgi:hypothetical protein